MYSWNWNSSCEYYNSIVVLFEIKFSFLSEHWLRFSNGSIEVGMFLKKIKRIVNFHRRSRPGSFDVELFRSIPAGHNNRALRSKTGFTVSCIANYPRWCFHEPSKRTRSLSTGLLTFLRQSLPLFGQAATVNYERNVLFRNDSSAVATERDISLVS